MNDIIIPVIVVGAIILFCEWFAMRQIAIYGFI